MTLDLLQWRPPSTATERVSVPRRPSDRPSIDARWAEFAAANPHVLATIRRLALSRVASGATRIGLKSLWEQVRETLRVEKQGAFALDNSLTAPAARWLIEVEPSLAPFIETRRRKS